MLTCVIWVGPIVRISPYELTIRDPAFYNELYVTENKRRTDNYDRFAHGIDMDGRYHFILTQAVSGSVADMKRITFPHGAP